MHSAFSRCSSRDYLGGEGAHVELFVQKREPTVFFFQLRSPAALHQAAVPAVHIFLQLGQDGVGKLDLGIVKLVLSIYIVPDAGYREHGVELVAAPVDLAEDLVGGLEVLAEPSLAAASP